MRRYMLFDLDGTLMESADGIVNSVKYALEKCGVNEPDRANLLKFIGPPLRDSFRKFYGFTAEQAEEAVGYYREYYAEKGIFEAQVQRYMPVVLDWLMNKTNTVRAVVTSKPQAYTERILEHFDLAKYFSLVVGADFEGKLDSKTELVRVAMEKLGAAPRDTAVIGDRMYDIIGALENGAVAIGVAFGYGSLTELMDNGAEYIAGSPEALPEILAVAHK